MLVIIYIRILLQIQGTCNNRITTLKFNKLFNCCNRGESHLWYSAAVCEIDLIDGRLHSRPIVELFEPILEEVGHTDAPGHPSRGELLHLLPDWLHPGEGEVIFRAGREREDEIVNGCEA